MSGNKRVHLETAPYNVGTSLQTEPFDGVNIIFDKLNTDATRIFWGVRAGLLRPEDVSNCIVNLKSSRFVNFDDFYQSSVGDGIDEFIKGFKITKITPNALSLPIRPVLGFVEEKKGSHLALLCFSIAESVPFVQSNLSKVFSGYVSEAMPSMKSYRSIMTVRYEMRVTFIEELKEFVITDSKFEFVFPVVPIHNSYEALAACIRCQNVGSQEAILPKSYLLYDGKSLTRTHYDEEKAGVFITKTVKFELLRLQTASHPVVHLYEIFVRPPYVNDGEIGVVLSLGVDKQEFFYRDSVW